ncbi:MAG TPA: acetyl-CoA C-acyltransferase [Candidatus Polarisedimenticolia bacterium]|nr:acetyl-CoA C-acyltransferase [Candidatus Polarisedimenticolia bacterium]
MEKSSKVVWILGGARTPMAEYNGRFRDIPETELGALAAREALIRAAIPAHAVQHAVFGNALQTSGNAMYGARHAALKAGLPIEVPAFTVNRLCGSGIQSILSAVHLIRNDEADTVLAGGMENLSQAPHVIRGARVGFRLGEGKLEDSLMVALMDSHCGLYMAQTAEKIAKERGISREEQDAFALRSQRLAEEAYRAGRMQEEIVPVKVREGRSEILFAEDDHRRADTTLEKLSRLPAAFSKEGTVTAGNASGIVDGAAAVVVSSNPHAGDRKPLGKIVAWGIAGVEPSIMGIGPVPATRQALERAGLRLSEIDLIEVNEAFAAQYLAVEKDLGLDRDRVNVNGGAIALGHPLGATGTRLVLTLLLELRRRNARFGLATACIGGGQGIAIIVESAGRG